MTPSENPAEAIYRNSAKQSQPSLDLGVLVGGVVIDDQMQVQVVISASIFTSHRPLKKSPAGVEC
jgi:hypothetical protein